jgi:hypothetical protein
VSGKKTWRWLLPAALAVLLGAGPGTRAGDKVKVCLVTVLASQRHNKVDERLTEIAEKVQKEKPKLKLRGFKLVDMTCNSLAPGEEWVVKLIEGQEAQVVIDKSADKNKCVVLRVKAPLLKGQVKYRTVCNKFLPIITGFTNKKGDVLILAVMVKPCRGK